MSNSEDTVLRMVPDSPFNTPELAGQLMGMKRQAISHALVMLAASRLLRRVRWGVYEITPEGRRRREELLASMGSRLRVGDKG